MEILIDILLEQNLRRSQSRLSDNKTNVDIWIRNADSEKESYKTHVKYNK